jgi:heme exporter protein B
LSGSANPPDAQHAAGGVPSGLNISDVAPSVKPATLLQQSIAVFTKDVRAELRNRAALNSILLFSITAMVVVAFAVGVQKPAPLLKAALLWVVLFFAAFSGLSHVFIHEEETGTATALRLSASATAIYIGKLAFNMLLLLVIIVVVVPMFVIMLDLQLDRPFAFLAVIGSGGLALGAGATIVAAIVAKARGKGALYGALGFPILLPLLMMAVRATQLTMTDVSNVDIARDLVGLASFGIMLITMSLVLFPFLWEE